MQFCQTQSEINAFVLIFSIERNPNHTISHSIDRWCAQLTHTHTQTGTRNANTAIAFNGIIIIMKTGGGAFVAYVRIYGPH